MSYISRIKAMVVCPEGEPLFSERCTEVSIDDESGGEFVLIRQPGAIREGNEIAINPEEWPKLREAIDGMVLQCKSEVAE